MSTRIVAGTGPDPLELIEQEFELPAPAGGEIVISVRAAGVNPTDWKTAAAGFPRRAPTPVGNEASGVITAVGAEASTAARPLHVGDEVLAFRLAGSYATDVLAPAADVFLKPSTLDFAQAANLLLVGTTAAEMLDVTRVARGDTIVVHGASGATGVSLLQQARMIGARVIGTASAVNADTVRRFGGEPVTYGEGLADRIRTLAPDGVDAALDCVGTPEARVVSLDLVADPGRIVSIADPDGAAAAGIRFIAGALPDSALFRAAVRQRLVDAAAGGELTVPVAHRIPLRQAADAFDLIRTQHPGGKIALIP